MELKVWVDGAQRIVCGVTEATTCQEVVIALAQAIGRTGRYTLVEKWRETERHLAPNENPLAALNKWGQYACDVQLILHRTGPSLSERPTSDSISRAPERTLYRQSLPPLAKLRPPNDRSLRRKEPKRKSLTFTAGPKGLIDIFGKGKESEIKHRVLHSQSTLDEFRKLVGLQKDRLQSLDGQLESNKNETRYWEGRIRSNGVEDDVVRLEQAVKKNGVEIEEEEFWENEWQIEEENEKQLKDQLEEVAGRTRECEDKLKEYSAKMLRIQNGIESETLRQELRESQLNEEEVKGNIVKIKGEIEIKCQHTTRLENSLKAVERTLGQVNKKFQEKEMELELLTKELRQVNLQQFIQQTGTKVTVLPAEPMDEEHSQQHKKELPILTGSLRRPNSSRQLPSNLRILQNPLTSGFNPEGIYV